MDFVRMTNTGNETFIKWFMAGQMGLPIPDDATEEMKSAYGRGYEVAEIESHWSEKREENAR